MYRRPAEIPRARLPLLDQVTIKTPCRESWDAMVGDDRTRFCTRCSKNVYDLSAMTQDEAETFLATHLDEEDACVRLYRRPDGRILTSECSRGARTRHARKVVAGVAAGLCAAFAGTLALANVHVPDGRNLPKARARIDVKRLGAAKSSDATNRWNAGITEDEAPGMMMGTGVSERSGLAMGGIGPSEPPFGPVPVLHEVSATVSPGLPSEVVRRTVRQNWGRTRLCYEDRLRAQPDLAGDVTVKFLIDRDGAVIAAEDAGSSLPDASTVACIVRGFSRIAFPKPEPEARVSASYRVSLRPRP